MRSELQLWWAQAEADRITADVTLHGDRYYACVFFCHQAVEKALKALVLKKTRNPQVPEMLSHSLIFLGKATKLPLEFHSFLRDLTADYVNTRYPSAAEEPPESLYDRAIATRTFEDTKKVLAWIKKRL